MSTDNGATWGGVTNLSAGDRARGLPDRCGVHDRGRRRTCTPCGSTPRPATSGSASPPMGRGMVEPDHAGRDHGSPGGRGGLRVLGVPNIAAVGNLISVVWISADDGTMKVRSIDAAGSAAAPATLSNWKATVTLNDKIGTGQNGYPIASASPLAPGVVTIAYNTLTAQKYTKYTGGASATAAGTLIYTNGTLGGVDYAGGYSTAVEPAPGGGFVAMWAGCRDTGLIQPMQLHQPQGEVRPAFGHLERRGVHRAHARRGELQHAGAQRRAVDRGHPERQRGEGLRPVQRVQVHVLVLRRVDADRNWHAVSQNRSRTLKRAGPTAPPSSYARAMTELERIRADVVACRACPRLVAWREHAAEVKVARFADQTYWARPVPGFGDPSASILVVGLAPAAHGGNRTGSIFTGDRSGDFLFAALYRAGFANRPTSSLATTASSSRGAYVTAVNRCAPPAQQAHARKSATGACPSSTARLEALEGLRVVVASARTPGTGRCGRWRSSGHRGEAEAQVRTRRGGDVGPYTLIGCFHPSQQNTFTGKLTPAMIDAVLRRAGSAGSTGLDRRSPRPARGIARRGARVSLVAWDATASSAPRSRPMRTLDRSARPPFAAWWRRSVPTAARSRWVGRRDRALLRRWACQPAADQGDLRQGVVR